MRVIRATDLRACEKPPPRAAVELTHAVTVRIAGVRFSLNTNLAGLADAFALRYAEHLDNGEPHFSYNVLRQSESYVFWCDHAGAWAWGGRLPVDAILFLADAAAISALIHYDAALASMHAAGIAYNNGAAAIIADSEGGKTTTAIACARAGLQVYSDERVLLRGNVVQPFWRRCRLRAGGAQLLGITSQSELSWRELFGDAALASPAPLRTVFVVAGRASRPRIREIQTAAALRAAGKWFDCSGTPLERTARALQAVRFAACFSLELGHPDETARAIRAMLSSRTAA
jgi:hypothetical protein